MNTAPKIKHLTPTAIVNTTIGLTRFTVPSSASVSAGDFVYCTGITGVDRNIILNKNLMVLNVPDATHIDVLTGSTATPGAYTLSTPRLTLVKDIQQNFHPHGRFIIGESLEHEDTMEHSRVINLSNRGNLSVNLEFTGADSAMISHVMLFRKHATIIGGDIRIL